MAMHTSDDELIQAARAGDATAFGHLQQRHWGWVSRLLVAMVHDDQQAEDLTQEAFLRVYCHLHEYTARGQFVAWLKRMVGDKGYCGKPVRALLRRRGIR